MSTQPYRRVVTGLDENGQSCVVIDGPPISFGRSRAMVWQTPALPADNSGSDDAVASGKFSRS
jgi:hypothetical protein